MQSQNTKTQQPHFTLMRLLTDLWKHLNLEKGFLLTARELFLKPGLTIQTILDGRADSLTEPFRFLAISVATITVAMALATPMAGGHGYKLAFIEEAEAEASRILQPRVDQLKRLSESQQQSREIRFRAKQAQIALQTSFSDWSYRAQAPWSNVLLLLAVPVYAFFTWLVVGRGLNLAEHLVLNAYIYGIQCILATLVMVPLILTSQVGLAATVYFIVSLVYQIVAWNSLLRFRTALDWAKCAFLVVITLVIYLIVGVIFMQAIIYLQLYMTK
ncbi:MAG: DUF3667 domain-containing protein [Pirellulaceae bacterium]